MNIENLTEYNNYTVNELLSDNKIVLSKYNLPYHNTIFPKSTQIRTIDNFSRNKIITKIDDELFKDFYILSKKEQTVYLKNNTIRKYIKCKEFGDINNSYKRYNNVNAPIDYNIDANSFLNIKKNTSLNNGLNSINTNQQDFKRHNDKTTIEYVLKWAKEQNIKYIYAIVEHRPYIISKEYTSIFAYYTVIGSTEYMEKDEVTIPSYEPTHTTYGEPITVINNNNGPTPVPPITPSLELLFNSNLFKSFSHTSSINIDITDQNNIQFSSLSFDTINDKIIININAASFKNSDNTFTQSISYGTTYTAPDIDITLADGIHTYPSNIDIDLSNYEEIHNIQIENTNGNILNNINSSASNVTIQDTDVTVNVHNSDNSYNVNNPYSLYSCVDNGTKNISIQDTEINVRELDSDGNVINSHPLSLPSGIDNGNYDITIQKWQRPFDWLPMPTVTATDQIFAGLHAVFDLESNFVAFKFETSTGDYRVDWGDGTVTDYASGALAQHNYDYSTYDVGNATLCSRGYKQAMITVTPLTGNLTTFNFQQRYVTSPVQNQPYSTGFLDIVTSMPNAVIGGSLVLGGITVRHTKCERVVVKSLGGCTSLGFFYRYFFSLQVSEIADTSGVKSIAQIHSENYSLIFAPNYDTSNVVDFNLAFAYCHSLIKSFNYDTSNGVNMYAMHYDNISLITPSSYNTQNATNMNAMHNNNISLVTLLNYDQTSATNTNNIVKGCNSLRWCDTSFKTSVSFEGCALSQQALVHIFNNLQVVVGQTINITGCWGASALTPTERAIATGKGWTIIG